MRDPRMYAVRQSKAVMVDTERHPTDKGTARGAWGTEAGLQARRTAGGPRTVERHQKKIDGRESTHGTETDEREGY